MGLRISVIQSGRSVQRRTWACARFVRRVGWCVWTRHASAVGICVVLCCFMVDVSKSVTVIIRLRYWVAFVGWRPSSLVGCCGGRRLRFGGSAEFVSWVSAAHYIGSYQSICADTHFAFSALPSCRGLSALLSVDQLAAFGRRSGRVWWLHITPVSFGFPLCAAAPARFLSVRCQFWSACLSTRCGSVMLCVSLLRFGRSALVCCRARVGSVLRGTRVSVRSCVLFGGCTGVDLASFSMALLHRYHSRGTIRGRLWSESSSVRRCSVRRLSVR